MRGTTYRPQLRPCLVSSGRVFRCGGHSGLIFLGLRSLLPKAWLCVGEMGDPRSHPLTLGKEQPPQKEKRCCSGREVLHSPKAQGSKPCPVKQKCWSPSGLPIVRPHPASPHAPTPATPPRPSHSCEALLFQKRHQVLNGLRFLPSLCFWVCLSKTSSKLQTAARNPAGQKERQCVQGH